MGKPDDPKAWMYLPFLPTDMTPEAAYRKENEARLQATLKPCPFCGDTPKLNMKNWLGERDVIICHCGITMGIEGKTVDCLVRSWNERKEA